MNYSSIKLLFEKEGGGGEGRKERREEKREGGREEEDRSPGIRWENNNHQL